MASTQMVSKWEVPEHPEIEWALRTGYPSWMQEKGSDASAASGGRSELSQWQRSKKSRKSVSPMIFSGTARGLSRLFTMWMIGFSLKNRKTMLQSHFKEGEYGL